MRRVLFILTAVSMLLSCSYNSGTPAEMAEVEMGIEGMVCAMGCAKMIEKEVSALNGVVKCEVDFEGKKAEVSYDKKVVSEGKIVELIQSFNEGQYKVVKLEEKKEEQEMEEDTEEISYNHRSFTFPAIITYFMQSL